MATGGVMVLQPQHMLGKGLAIIQSQVKLFGVKREARHAESSCLSSAITSRKARHDERVWLALMSNERSASECPPC